MERPRITLADATPKEMKRFEHVFDLELRIENPNESALPIKGFKKKKKKAPGEIVENLPSYAESHGSLDRG